MIQRENDPTVSRDQFASHYCIIVKNEPSGCEILTLASWASDVENDYQSLHHQERGSLLKGWFLFNSGSLQTVKKRVKSVVLLSSPQVLSFADDNLQNGNEHIKKVNEEDHRFFMSAVSSGIDNEMAPAAWRRPFGVCLPVDDTLFAGSSQQDGMFATTTRIKTRWRNEKKVA